MSDSEDFIITYTTVSSPYGGLSDIGSPGVDGPHMMPEDPYAYVVATFQAPPSLDYVSEDDILPAEELPLPTAASPTAESLGYIDESDPEDDPEEDPEDDPDEDPTDYPADEGEIGDDEDKSSDDDEDEAIDHAPYVEETEPFETDESAITPPLHLAYRTTMDEREEIHEADLPLRKRLCTAHTGKYELGESFEVTAARLRELVKDDLYRFVNTVEQGECSTPAAMEIGYGITDT
nr:hypothetical protein [Tanacetum cinerariifolium]